MSFSGTWGEYPEPGNPDSQIKFWHSHFRINEKKMSPEDRREFKAMFDRTKNFNFIITTFKVGQLTPEECFYIIEDQLNKCASNDVNNETSFTSVILSNTAEICTGFPLIRRDPLFLPSLLDLFEAHNLTSIGIGVTDEDKESINELNFSLIARADYRLNLSHYPNIDKLSALTIRKYRKMNELADQPKKKKLEKAGLTDFQGSFLDEQKICLIIDNVIGKQYERKQRWLRVYLDKFGKSKKLKKKVFTCTEMPYMDDKL
jgi:hypothetical protein